MRKKPRLRGTMNGIQDKRKEGAKKHREYAVVVVQISERKVIWAAQKERNLLRIEARRKR